MGARPQGFPQSSEGAFLVGGDWVGVESEEGPYKSLGLA